MVFVGTIKQKHLSSTRFLCGPLFVFVVVLFLWALVPNTSSNDDR